MAMVQSIGQASNAVMAALVAGLELEFGHAAGAALAERFLDAEETDFAWDARQSERWLGQYHGDESSELELDRVAIIGRMEGRWFVAICIVDGDGRGQGLTGRRAFCSAVRAREAYANAH